MNTEHDEPSQVHDLKVWAPYWEDVNSGRKTVEIRLNDRWFQVGDVLLLRETRVVTNPDRVDSSDPVVQWRASLTRYEPTGRVCRRMITHVCDGQFGLLNGYVALSLAPVAEPPQEPVDPDRVAAITDAIQRLNTDIAGIDQIQDEQDRDQLRAAAEARYLTAIQEATQ